MASSDGRPASESADRRSGVSGILIKIATGVAAWLVTYGVAKTAVQNELWSVGASIFVSGLVLVVQFLIKVERELVRLRRTHEVTATSSDASLTRAVTSLNSATVLYQHMERSSVATSALESLIHGAGSLQPVDHAYIMKTFADAEVERLADLLTSLQNGEVVYEGEQRDWLIGLTRVAATSIDAMSLVFRDGGDPNGSPILDNGLWFSEVGQRYLDAQADAVQHRSVAVRRIFLLDDPTLVEDPLVIDVMRQHFAMKVEVLAIPMDSVPELLRRSVYDLAIFDSAIYYRNRPAATIRSTRGPTRSQTQLITRADQVSAEVRRYKELWDVDRSPAKPSRSVKSRGSRP